MPINVRSGGTWKTTDRVYIPLKSGGWKRAHGAYAWGTKGGVTKWWPMFQFLVTPPAPTK